MGVLKVDNWVVVVQVLHEASELPELLYLKNELMQLLIELGEEVNMDQGEVTKRDPSEKANQAEESQVPRLQKHVQEEVQVHLSDDLVIVGNQGQGLVYLELEV